MTSAHFLHARGTVHRKEVKPCDEPLVSVWPTPTARESCEVAQAKRMHPAPARDIWETSKEPLTCGPGTCAAWPYLALSRFVCTMREHDLALVFACCTLFHFSGGYPAPSEQFQNDPLLLTAMCLENIRPSGFALAPTNPGDINDSWQTDKEVCLYLKAIRFYRKKALTHTHTLSPGGFSRRNSRADVWQSELRRIPPSLIKATLPPWGALRRPTTLGRRSGEWKRTLCHSGVVQKDGIQGLPGFLRLHVVFTSKTKKYNNFLF